MAESTLEGVSQELVVFNSNLPTLMDAQFETLEGVFESLEDVSKSSMEMMSQTLLRIEDVLLSMLNVIPVAIEKSSDDLIATTNLADKKKKRNKDPDDEGGSKFISAFTKGKDDATGKGIEDMLDDMLPISALMGGLGAAFGMITTTLIPLIPIVLAVGAGIAALTIGLMTAFDYFNSKEGTLGEKLFAGVEGFFQGLVSVVTWPFDKLKELMSGFLKSFLGEDNFLSAFLDSFSYFDTLSAIVRELFQFVSDIVEVVMIIVDYVSEAMAPILEAMEPAKKGINAMVDGIGAFIDWIISIGTTAAKFLGFSFPESTEVQSEVEMTTGEQRDALKETTDSALYDKNGMLRDSVIDESKLEGASKEQLQSIVNDDDLSDDQMNLVIAQLNKLTSGAEDTTLLDALKTESPAMNEEEAAQAKINQAASDAKSAATLASMAPEELAAMQEQMGVEVVKTDQYKLNEEAARQRKVRAKAERDKVAADKRLAEMSSAEAKNPGSVKSAIKRDPVTGMPLKGQINAPKGSEGSSFTVLDQISGEVQTFDDYEKASMFADAMGGLEVKTVPKSSIAGKGNALGATAQVQSGTSKMNDGKSDLASGGGGGSVAVNAPTTTTNVSNSTHRGAMPNAMDASDRTDRRRATF